MRTASIIISCKLALLLCLNSVMSGQVHAQVTAGKVLFEMSAFSSAEAAAADGWSHWSAREETSPHFFISRQPSLDGAGSLGISGASKSVANGCWHYLVQGVKGGEFYRFESFYRSRGVPNPRHQVIAMLDWRDADGRRVAQPEYVADQDADGQWRKVAECTGRPRERPARGWSFTSGSARRGQSGGTGSA